MKKNQAYIDSDSDYKLDYTLLYKVFEEKSTRLFDYFLHFTFGIEHKEFKI